MQEDENRTFHNRTIGLDGRSFRNRRFIKCDLRHEETIDARLRRTTRRGITGLHAC